MSAKLFLNAYLVGGFDIVVTPTVPTPQSTPSLTSVHLKALNLIKTSSQLSFSRQFLSEITSGATRVAFLMTPKRWTFHGSPTSIVLPEHVVYSEP